jgi:hypothetical protein
VTLTTGTAGPLLTPVQVESLLIKPVLATSVALNPLCSRVLRPTAPSVRLPAVGPSTHTADEARSDTWGGQQPARPSPTSDRQTGDVKIDRVSQPQYLATSPPSTLRVSAPERAMLAALAPLLTRSPRALTVSAT